MTIFVSGKQHRELDIRHGALEDMGYEDRALKVWMPWLLRPAGFWICSWAGSWPQRCRSLMVSLKRHRDGDPHLTITQLCVFTTLAQLKEVINRPYNKWRSPLQCMRLVEIVELGVISCNRNGMQNSAASRKTNQDELCASSLVFYCIPKH